MFARVFDLRQLAALPPPRASDLPWLLDWSTAANGVAKSILYFGITPSGNPIADEAAMRRNMADYQEYKATAFDFMTRITERVAATLALAKTGQTRTVAAEPRKPHRRVAHRQPASDFWVDYDCGWWLEDRNCAPHEGDARDFWLR